MGVLEVWGRKTLTKTLLYGCLIGGGLIVAFPLLWMVVGSFRPTDELLTMPPILIPRVFTLDNYRIALERLPLIRYVWNSSLVAGVQVGAVLLTSSFAGHIFSKYNFKGKNLIFLFLISTIMIPFYSFVISLFQFISRLGWVNTYQGIFGPWCVEPFGIFLMRQFMQEIPRELIDSAKIDGASEGRIYFQIVLPLSKPALGVLGIFVFLWSWNSFFWPLIVITKSKMFTLPVGIATLVSNMTYYPEIGPQFAMGVVAIVPVTIIYLLFHKTFTKGIALTGLK